MAWFNTMRQRTRGGATAKAQPETSQQEQLAPTEAVAQAMAAGCTSRADIAQRTGLHAETVSLIIDRMERSGRLRREALGSMCSLGGCGSCAHATGTGGCGAGVPGGGNNGPVSLVLQPRRAE